MKRILNPALKGLFVAGLASLLALGACQEQERQELGAEPGLGAEGAPPGGGLQLNEPDAGVNLGTEGGVIGSEMGDPMMQSEPAIQTLVNARCTRAQVCGEIGADGDYASIEACRSELGEELRDDLSAEECPEGINATELRECLQEIEQFNCDQPFDELGRIVACRSSDMCNAL